MGVGEGSGVGVTGSGAMISSDSSFSIKGVFTVEGWSVAFSRLLLAPVSASSPLQPVIAAHKNKVRTALFIALIVFCVSTVIT